MNSGRRGIGEKSYSSSYKLFYKTKCKDKVYISIGTITLMESLFCESFKWSEWDSFFEIDDQTDYGCEKGEEVWCRYTCPHTGNAICLGI